MKHKILILKKHHPLLYLNYSSSTRTMEENNANYLRRKERGKWAVCVVWMNSNSLRESESTDGVVISQQFLRQCLQTWGCGADYLYNSEKSDKTNEYKHLIITVQKGSSGLCSCHRGVILHFFVEEMMKTRNGENNNNKKKKHPKNWRLKNFYK